MVATKERQLDHVDRGAMSGVRRATADAGQARRDRRARTLLAISGAEPPRRRDASADRPLPVTAEGRQVRRWQIDSGRV